MSSEEGVMRFAARGVSFRASLAIATAVFVSACSLTSRPFDFSQIEKREGVRLVKLQHIGQKERWDCGIGALLMIYAYWGDSTTYDRILDDLLKIKGTRAGVSAAELKEHAVRRGYHAFILQTDLEGILEQIGKGRPVVVCRRMWGLNHYEIVFGYDGKRKEVLIDDPAKGQVRRFEATFRRQHTRANGFTLLIVPKGI